MARQDQSLGKKLEEIRGLLMEDPTKEDLEKMQLQVGLLANLDLMMADADPGHHHDHMDDHDHAHVFLKAIDIAQRPA